MAIEKSQQGGWSSEDTDVPSSSGPDEKRKKANSDTDPEVDKENHAAIEPISSNIYDQYCSKSYRTMRRKDTILILTTSQLGLATVSLPSILLALGIVPGLIAIIGFGIFSWYGGFQLLQFYRKHPQIVNIVDAAAIVGGKPFAALTAAFMLIQLMFTCSSAIVTTSIALNTISEHAICTVAFMVVAAVLFYVMCLPRTMKFVSMSGGPNAVGVLGAALIVVVGLAVQRPQGAPEGWTRKIDIIGHPSFRDASNACLKALWAYCTNVSFLTYMAEMEDPVRDFKFCLGVLEIFSIVIYSVMAVTIYCLAGQHTVSPAIGAAPILLSKVSYGLMMLPVIATALSCGHGAIKLMYVELLKKLGALSQVTDRSVKSWASWVGCVTVFWIIAFIVANVIPVFDSILQISAATTVPWLTLGHSSIFWLYINSGKYSQHWKKTCVASLCVGMIVLSLLVNGLGLWSSITELLDFFADSTNDIRGVFSCGNNA